MASVTKLITALVILDAHPLGENEAGPTLTFDEADHDLYDDYYVQGVTIAPMPEGSAMSLRDALATMLIPSASNYADAVSSWAFGSQSGFVSAARRWLAANGLAQTTIVDSTGISPRNTSTAADLIALGKLAAAHPVVAQIAATPSLTLPGPGTMNNTNGLLGVDGITGLKTGNLGEGTHNLVYTAVVHSGRSGPLSVTGVVLGGATRDSVAAVVRATLAGLRSGFHDIPLATAGQPVGSATTAWGSEVDLVVANGAAVFTWSDTPITVALETFEPAAYEDGVEVGEITWTAGSQTETSAVRVEGDVEPPSTWWRLTHPDELRGG